MSTRSAETYGHSRSLAVRSVLPFSLLLTALLLGGACRTGTEPAPAAEGGWLPRVQQAIAEKEYEASHNDLGLEAPNRSHNLRTYFDGPGIRAHDRTAEGSPELLGLSLVAMGRGEELSPLESGEVVSEGARVEVRRPGLVEWYVNTPTGPEQGFTLEAPPPGDGPVTLELSVRPGRAALERDRVVFSTPTGRRLEFGGLAAFDAVGTTVAARFQVPSGDRLRIVLAAENAVYPLTVDPLLTSTAEAQLESDQKNARLGWTVSGAGDVNADGYADVIVGASGYDSGQIHEGAAFVFLGNADSEGRLVRARQLRGGDDSTPVQPWGLSRDAQEFQVELQATHPGGRGHVKLEIETCAAGVPFDDLSCGRHLSASWTDVTASSGGVTLTETVDTLADDELHRWRARVLYAPFSVTQPGITPAPYPPHGPWRRYLGQSEEADVATPEDTDRDGVPDEVDNCSTIANGDQADSDRDLVGNVCDNCIGTGNPPASYPPNRTTTGGQLDDDADGYGNLCDAKFTPGPIVTALDTIEYKAAINRPITASTCGKATIGPCDRFDLDGASPVITALDTIAFKVMLNLPVGPKCTACGVDWVALPCVGDACP
jgi:hypothetical protein